MAKGIQRQLDALGRVNIPKDIRDRFNLNPGDTIEVYCSPTQVIMEPTHARCVLCSEPATITFKGVGLCEKCKMTIYGGTF
jgi:AbrB family transcriptional regulator, transcriptional pleiotropic regulator of transition state genes